MSFLVTPDISKTPEKLPSHPYTFPLDPFQQHAIKAIANDEHVLICAKTGSGKTVVGEYQIYHSLKKGKRIFYTTPIKSLSNQNITIAGWPETGHSRFVEFDLLIGRRQTKPVNE